MVAMPSAYTPSMGISALATFHENLLAWHLTQSSLLITETAGEGVMVKLSLAACQVLDTTICTRLIGQPHATSKVLRILETWVHLETDQKTWPSHPSLHIPTQNNPSEKPHEYTRAMRLSRRQRTRVHWCSMRACWWMKMDTIWRHKKRMIWNETPTGDPSSATYVRITAAQAALTPLVFS